MAAITSSAIGLASAGFQAYQGFKQQKDAKNALNNYNRQDLSKSNAFENMPISTVGSDLMREESQQTSANTVDALQRMGTRGIAMLPGVVANSNAANQEARGYLDNQINVRNNAIANDNIDIRRMKEDRENADLAGIGNQMQVGSQNMWSGIRGAGASIMSGFANYTPGERGTVEAIGGDLKPIGISKFKAALPTASLPDYSRIYKNGF